MHKDYFINKTIYSSIYIYVAIAILLSSLVAIDSSWILGWLLGGAVSIIGYFFNILLINVFSKMVKSKSSGFWMGWLKSIIHLIYHSTFIILLIIFNRYIKGFDILNGGFESMLHPINVILYIAGISVVMFGTILTQIINLVKGGEKYERNSR